MGSKHPTIVPYQAFPTEDSYAVVACASENIWPRFCEAIGREDLVDDERFATNTDRVTNRDELEEILSAEIVMYTTDEIVERLRHHDVPASAVKDMAEVFEHPQVRARHMRQSVDHPTVGTVEMPGSPMNYLERKTELDEHPPLLGEQTNEILAEFDYSECEIENFHAKGVV